MKRHTLKTAKKSKNMFLDNILKKEWLYDRNCIGRTLFGYKINFRASFVKKNTEPEKTNGFLIRYGHSE